MITIQNNQNRRRILMLDGVFNLEDSLDFPESMFDAVFIKTNSPNETKTILHSINPVTSNKCCYKPFFVLKGVEGQLDDYNELVDGYVYDMNEESALHKVEEIIQYRTELGLTADNGRLTSANLFFIRLCRYLISRKRYRQSPVPQEGSSLGYVIPIFNLFYELGMYKLSEYIIFYQSMLEKGYISTVRFINKIYLCPDCLHSHLLYIESCPQCHSSSIKSEEVIHHFRCANISPEHTYNFGGQLRCPKCHQLLRHIGVDYDRPSTVYTCNSCSNNFLQPQMKAVCTSCQKESDVSSLLPYDVTIYEITEEGCGAIISPNIGFTVYTDFYDNYLEYERFVNRIRLLANQNRMEQNQNPLSIVKIWVLDSNETTCMLKTEWIAYVCERFATYKVSSANNMIYIKEIKGGHEQNESEAIFFNHLLGTLEKAASMISPGERICYARSLQKEGIEDYIAELSYISTVPDGEYEYVAKAMNSSGECVKNIESMCFRDKPDNAAEIASALYTENADHEFHPIEETEIKNQTILSSWLKYVLLLVLIIGIILLAVWILAKNTTLAFNI